MRLHVFAADELYPATFEIVVPAVEYFPGVCQFVEIADDRIFNQFVARASALTHHLVKLRLHFGFDMHFHCVGSLFLEYVKEPRKGADMLDHQPYFSDALTLAR